VRKLTQRKRRLIVETPCVIRGRPLVVDVEASGLQLREKGRRSKIDISWAQIYNRAAEIAADRLREARRQRRSKSQRMNERASASFPVNSPFIGVSPRGPVSPSLT
jgi:hypothetical protein